MKNTLLTFLMCCLISWQAQSQVAAGCGQGRYQTEVFTNFVKTTVDYGQNVRYNNQNQILKMDIYEPENDNISARPVVILAHGGSFIGGLRTDPDMVYFGEHFAKRGFVVASIEYRLGMNLLSLDSIEVMKAVVRGVHDMRAAVRYFRKSVAESGNPHKIDPNMIFIGGTSAGAIASLHTAYLDDMNEAPTYLQTIITNMGGNEGNSGNSGYSSTSIGVLSGAGALGEKEWIVAGNQPLVSVHGTADDVVPYGTEMQYLPGTGVAVKVVEGSGSIHPYAISLGVSSTLKTFNGAGHVPYMSSSAYMDTTMQYFGDFLYENVCGIVSVTPSLSANLVKIFPNPALNQITISLGTANATVNFYDATGRCVQTAVILSGETQLPLQLASGLYHVQVLSEGKQFSQTLAIQP